MPRSDEPRIVIRVSVADKAILDAAASAAGVATGALVREGALRYAREVAGEAAAGQVRMRRRSVPSSEVEKSEPVAPPPSGSDRVAMFRQMTARRPR